MGDKLVTAIIVRKSVHLGDTISQLQQLMQIPLFPVYLG